MVEISHGKSRIRVVVKTHQPAFGFVRKDEWNGVWVLHVRALPLKSKANREIEYECTRLFGVPVKIASGLSSNHKVLEIPLPPFQVERILTQSQQTQLNQNKPKEL